MPPKKTNPPRKSNPTPAKRKSTPRAAQPRAKKSKQEAQTANGQATPNRQNVPLQQLDQNQQQVQQQALPNHGFVPIILLPQGQQGNAPGAQQLQQQIQPLLQNAAQLFPQAQFIQQPPPVPGQAQQQQVVPPALQPPPPPQQPGRHPALEPQDNSDIPTSSESEDEQGMPPPPPPPHRPHVAGLGAAVSAPQSAVSALSVTNATGMQTTFIRILSDHVEDKICSKIWKDRYIDIGWLIKQDPTEDKPYALIDDVKGRLNFTKQRTKVKIESWVMWNRAMRIFAEIYACKKPLECIYLLQYIGLLSELSSRFSFGPVYAYDKKFWYANQKDPTKVWYLLDQQLALRYLYNTPNSSTFSRQTHTFKPSRVKDNFLNCLKFNHSRCTFTHCKFPHVCGNCGQPGHKTNSCSGFTNASSTVQQLVTAPQQRNPNRGQLPPTNAGQGQQPAHTTAGTSAAGTG